MSVVDEIKERLDIAEVLGRYVHLQKAGRNLKGLCPFHSEKTPSFFVFPDGQRWHCFGCNRGGDLFTFVMEREGWDFRTALEELARQAGVELRPRTPTEVQAAAEGDRLRAALEAAAGYYHTLLLTAPQAAFSRDYLKRRGFVPETITHFQLGYSLSSWDALRTELFGQGFTVEELVKAGLLVEKEGGGTYDRFRNRLMIPIYDRQGRIVAFGSRALAPEDLPKYMNSPQTPLFDKSRILFGLHHAIQAIRQADTAVIVEGYMDVMIAHQAGYANVVAPMGTALTEAHLKQLQRLTHRFILALDPDAAGIEATLRGLDVARETLDRQWEAIFDPRGLIGYEGRLQADIRVLSLPDGLDPDELILQDAARWEQLIGASQPVIRFYFQQLLQRENPQEPKGKARIVDALLPLLRDIADGVEREAYAQEIALRLGLDARTLLDRLRARDRAEAVRREAAVAAPGHQAHTADLESYALTLLMRYSDLPARADARLAELGLEPLQSNDFSPTYRLIWEAWLEVLHNPEAELGSLLPLELQQQAQQWLNTPLSDLGIEQVERELLRTVLRLRERQLRAMLQQIQGLVAEDQAEGDLKATRYASALKALHQTLNQVQQALGRRK